jgi:hypothetical protein
MRGERGMSDVVETTSDEDGGAQGLEERMEGRKESERSAMGVKGRKWAIILLFHRGRTPRWR